MEKDSNHLVCAIDLGGTNLRAANIDRAGHIHHRLKQPTPASASADEIVAEVSATVRACEAVAAKSDRSIHTVSLVVPGSVQAETGVIVNAPNIPSLRGFKLGAALEDALAQKVLIENDANAAALGEMWQGAARGCRTIVCFTLGTGVGSGIILDGQLWRGADGTAGEIGHTSIDPFGGVQCKCGNVGCLEVYASATAIVRMTREALANNQSSSLHSLSADDLTAEKIFRAASAGDELARDVFQRMGTYLGVALANVVNTFNPERIVIGGGVSAAFDLFALRARDELMKRAFPVPAKRCQLVKAECGDDAGLLGAAWLACQNRQQ
jgi:glucokinase